MRKRTATRDGDGRGSAHVSARSTPGKASGRSSAISPGPNALAQAPCSQTAALAASNVRIIERAEMPQHPTKPNVPVNLLLGLLAGGACALGATFFCEYFDTSVKSSEEVEGLRNAALAIARRFSERRCGIAPFRLGKHEFQDLCSGGHADKGPQAQLNERRSAQIRRADVL